MVQVPFADCINHSSESTASLDYSTEENAVVLVADRDYQPGDEIVVSYGAEKPNSELLIK
jgi:SET domain-containing protein